MGVYLHFPRGNRIFTEMGFWDPKNQKIFFLPLNDLKWSETVQKRFLECFYVIFNKIRYWKPQLEKKYFCLNGRDIRFSDFIIYKS